VSGAAPPALAPVFAALAAAWIAGGCDAVVTSVGAWEPRREPDAAPDAAADAAEPAVERVLYIEAEDGELSGGFTVAPEAGASNGFVLVPPPGAPSDVQPGPARARYAFELRAAGDYLLWGRSYAPGPDNNRFWFQLDGGPWFIWRISTGETWFWDDFHDDREYGRPLVFPLQPGAHELVIASCVEGVQLDRLYVTAEGDEPPGNDTPCDPPHTIEIGADCLPSCGLLDGTACGDACAGQMLLPAYDCAVCCRIEP
jgi:hypothetical protein